MSRARIGTLVAVALVASASACHDTTSTPDGVSALTIAPDSLALTAEDSAPLTATAMSASGAPLMVPNIGWGSHDSTLVRVNQRGQVFAVRAGTTTVSAFAGSKVASSVVTATYPPLTGVREYAHRGFGSVFPENTLLAIDSAFARGADGIEADFQVTSDSVAVVIHDATVDRTTNGSGVVAAMSVAEIRALDACAKSGPKWGSCQIPLAEEFIRKVSGRGLLIIDLKGPWPESRLRSLLAIVRENKMTDATMVTSFDIRHLARARKLDARITLGWLQGNTSDPSAALALGKVAILPEEVGMRKDPAGTIAFDSVLVAHGSILGAWTVYAPNVVPALRALGVRWFVSGVPLDKSALAPQ